MSTIKFGIRIAASIFGLVAILHLMRVVTGIGVLIGSWYMPIWFNWLGFFGASFMCIWLWNLSNKKKD